MSVLVLYLSIGINLLMLYAGLVLILASSFT